MSTSRTPLLTLPVELIELIFDNILDPWDFCNASSTCKTLQSASSRLMEEHKALAEEYQILTFPGDANVWAVLGEILKDRRIRHHIRDVDFEAERQMHYDPSVENPWETPQDALLPPIELLNDMKQLDGFESLPFDPVSFESGYDDPFNALLIRQLPNLRDIRYIHNEEERNFHSFIIGDDLSAHPPFLNRLRTVNIGHWDTEGGMSLAWVIAFMRLPSVRTINGHMIEAGEDFSVDFGKKSNITTLDLSYSCIELGAFDQLMQLTQNLETFSYEHGGGIVGNAECDPYGMVAVLLKHAGHSLETLIMSYGDDDDMFEDITYCSIKDFQKLKNVELDHLILVPYQEETSDDADVDEPLSQGFYVEQPPPEGPSPLDLANALPPTIQHLQVNRFPNSDGMPSLRHLLSRKEEGQFPDLKSICIGGFPHEHSPLNGTEGDDLQKAFERVGVVLKDGD